MDTKQRREFLKNSLKLGAVAGATLVAVKSAFASEKNDSEAVVVGKSKKDETLYKESKLWKDYYKIAR